MTKTLKVLGAIALLAIGFALGVYGSRQSGGTLAGVSYDVQKFAGDVYQGLQEVLMFQNGQFVGPINTDDAATTTASLAVGGSAQLDRLRFGANGVLRIAAAATTSITAAQLCDYGVVEWSPTVANASATLPTAAAIQADCITREASFKDILWRNRSTAASTTIFIAGASTTLQMASSSVNLVAGADSMLIRFYYGTSTVSDSAMIEADGILFK